MTASRRDVLCGGLALAALPSVALAHRQKRTETLVEWTGEGFAITHTFHRHDAEVALSRAGYIDTPEIESLRSRALMAIHVEETFGLIGVPLTTLGAEATGNQLFVYQEAAMAELPEALSVDARMLRGLYADQVNAVNVKVGREVRSVDFEGDDGVKVVELG